MQRIRIQIPSDLYAGTEEASEAHPGTTTLGFTDEIFKNSMGAKRTEQRRLIKLEFSHTNPTIEFYSYYSI